MAPSNRRPRQRFKKRIRVVGGRFKKRYLIASLLLLSIFYLLSRPQTQPASVTVDKPIIPTQTSTPPSPVIITKSIVDLIPETTLENIESQLQQKHHDHGIDWSKYAYVLYATSPQYLCNAIIMFSQLSKLQTKAKFILLYNKIWDYESSPEFQKIQEASFRYKIIIKPVDAGADKTNWGSSIAKLNAFELIEYKRIIYMDSDSMVLQNLDELFFIPESIVAMPRAYWLVKPKEVPEKHWWDIFSSSKENENENENEIESESEKGNDINGNFIWGSHIMIIKPSKVYFDLLQQYSSSRQENEYDMEIINKVFDYKTCREKSLDKDLPIPECLILPHSKYGVLTSEFVNINHKAYLANPEDTEIAINSFKNSKTENYYWDNSNFDSTLIRSKLKHIHFSDWPIPKPWKVMTGLGYDIPICYKNKGIKTNKKLKDCEGVAIWNDFYTTFINNMKEICGTEPSFY